MNSFLRLHAELCSYVIKQLLCLHIDRRDGETLAIVASYGKHCGSSFSVNTSRRNHLPNDLWTLANIDHLSLIQEFEVEM